MPIWLIQIVVDVVLSIASTLIQQATRSQQQAQQKAIGYRGSVQTGGTVPLSFLVGSIGVPGKLEYRNAWGSAGGTPNAYLVDVLSLGDLPIHGVTGFFVNSQAVTKTGTGHTTQGYPVAEYSSDGADHLWWEFFDGAQTTANSYLAGAFGTDADRPWQSDMIGRGIPYVTMTALIEESLWTGFPSYMVVCQGIPLYDPRQDSTAGGSGSQRWADPSTWTFSDNNAVIIYNILRGIHDNSATVTTLGPHVWGGHARAEQLPYDTWSAAMDACDTAVALAAGGTEKRFRAGREISVNERPADVIGELLVGCNGRLAMAGGSYYLLIGVPATADGSFTDDDLIATEGATLDPFPNLDSIVNGATATYIEPTQAWESKETSPYYRADLEAEDDDRRQLTGLELKTTFSGTQAQRILKATVEESRRFVRHVVTLPPGYGQYRPLQVLSWTSTANGYAGKLFLVTARTEAPNGNVVLGLQEIDPADHDWTAATDESPLSFAPLTPIRPPVQMMSGWTATPTTLEDADGIGRRAAVTVTATGGLPDVRAVRVQVRLAATGAMLFDGEVPYDPAAVSPSWVISAQFVGATAYEVRGRFLPFSGRTTYWSNQDTDGTEGAWLSVTTPAVPDVADIERAQLAASLRALVDYFNSAIADLQESVGKIGSILEAQDFANYQDKQTLTNKVTSQVGSAMAIAGQLFTAASSDIAAEATARTAAIAAMGSAFAGGLLEFDSAVTGSGAGATATIAAKIRAQVGDAVAQGGWMWKATADGAGHTTVQALLQQDTLYLVDGAGNVKTAITFDLTTGKIIGASLSLGSGAVNIDATGITIGTHVSISATGAITLSA